MSGVSCQTATKRHVSTKVLMNLNSLNREGGTLGEVGISQMSPKVTGTASG